MASNKPAATAAEEKDPNALVWMHHEETGGVRAGKRRTLRVWGRRGWKEGVGKVKGLPDAPAVEGPVVIGESGEPEVAQTGAADVVTQTATAATARQG